MFSCEGGLGVSLEALQHVYAKLNSVFAQNFRPPLMSCVARENGDEFIKISLPEGLTQESQQIFN